MVTETETPARILEPSGALAGEAPVTVAEAKDLYRAMSLARAYDLKCVALQRQGRLAAYSPFRGQEAAQIGAVAAIDRNDWFVGSYRDNAAMIAHGYPVHLLLLGRMGDERGGQVPEDVFALPPAITVGGHMIHAVGLAWAARRRGEDQISLTTFGDGATSEGDFHEAMNFAGVLGLGVVFVCENNQYAISTPRARQTASQTIAIKAGAYGIPGRYVDGNDVFAMIAATREAVDRARYGRGPTLIEALTFRMGPHTTADNPDLYRRPEAVDEWESADPLLRLRRFLEQADAWNDAEDETLAAENTARLEEAVRLAEDLSPLSPEEIFTGSYQSPTKQLRSQLDELMSDLEAVGWPG